MSESKETAGILIGFLMMAVWVITSLIFTVGGFVAVFLVARMIWFSIMGGA